MGPCWGAAWGCVGRSMEVRLIVASGCAAAQQRTAHGRSMRLRTGAAWGCAGGSVKLRWAAAAAEGVQRVAQQRALNGDCAGAAWEKGGNAQGRSVGPRTGAAWGGVGAQRGAAQVRSLGRRKQCSVGRRWGAGWWGAGAQGGAAHGHRVGVRMGARWRCTWAKGGAAHGRGVGPRRGTGWGCA